MNTYRFAVYVGPTHVSELAMHFSDAGAIVLTEGTEHIYILECGINIADARDSFQALLQRTYSHCFGITWRDVRFVARESN